MASPTDIHSLRVLRQHLNALAIAVLARDPVQAMIASGRLRRTVYRACREADAAAMALLARFVSEKVQPMLSLAWLVPDLTPPMYAYGLDHDQDEAPHLVGLRACKADLPDTNWCSIHAEDCHLDGACLRSAVLDSVLLEGCNFDDADLTGTWWRWAKVKACSFANARLTNATLEYARFVDCNLCDADFSALPGCHATAWRTTFVRCDLRGSLWNARGLAGSMFVDCKLEGARAAEVADHDVGETDPAAAPDPAIAPKHSDGDVGCPSPNYARGRWMS